MIDLRTSYSKCYKVSLESSWEGGDKVSYYEIQGKRGYIRPYGNSLEVYISNLIVAHRIERDYKQFKPKNHYDDAIAFTFEPEYLPWACQLIKAKKRRQMTPEGLERLARMRSLLPKRLKASVSEV